jgi:hypothetical protein
MNKDDEIKNDWQYLDMKRDMRKHVGDTAQRHYRKFPLNMSKHYKELEKPGAYVDYISDEMTSSNNPWKNESKNMNKKLIRLTEGDLHRIVKESVRRVLRETDELTQETYQVNISDTVDGKSIAWVSRYSPDGYVGRLTDTVYSDGSDSTDWCVSTGTKEECDNYAIEYNNKGLQ